MAHRPSSAFRPRVERLEDRTVPTLFTVTTTAIDFTVDGQVSLLEAMQAANTNGPAGDAPAGDAGLDSIVFAPALNGQTITIPITLSVGLAITEDLTITGPGADLLTVSGGGTSRIFLVNIGGSIIDVEIRSLTLTAGSAGLGGAIYSAENLTIRDSVISNSTPTRPAAASTTTAAR